MAHGRNNEPKFSTPISGQSAQDRPRPESTGIPEYAGGQNSNIMLSVAKRQRALLEFIASERSYASDLAHVRDVYIPVALGSTIPPVSPPSDYSGSSTPFAIPTMTSEDVKIVFRNILEIAALAEKFVEDLEMSLCSNLEGGQGNDIVGELFLRTLPELERPYKYYITRHATALGRLQHLPQIPSYCLLRSTQSMSSSQSQSWDVASLLAKPMQRLLHYPLLLTDIINHTPDPHPDKGNLCLARTTIGQVARNIDDARQRVEVVKDVLASQSMKKPRPSGVIAPLRISKLMSVGLTSVKAAITQISKPHEGVDEKAIVVKTLQAELKQIERFALRFARNVVDFGKMTSNIMLALRTWAYSFGAVLDFFASQSSDAFDSFLEVVERGLLTLASDLEKNINKRFLEDLSYLLMTINQPLKLIASMDEHQPQHFQLLDIPTNAKNKPASNLVTSSNKYTCLRDQLVAELPTYIRLLHKGLAILVRRLAEIQATFWGGVRDCWVGLYDGLDVEFELVGGSEICTEWFAGWSTVDQRLTSLTIARPVQEPGSESSRENEEGSEDYLLMLLQAKEREEGVFTFRDRKDKREFMPLPGESPRHFRNSGRSHPSTLLGNPTFASRVSVMAQIEEEREENVFTSVGPPFVNPAQMHADNPDEGSRPPPNAQPTNFGTGHWTRIRTKNSSRLSTEREETSEAIDEYKTWSNMSSKEHYYQTESSPFFSVQSFEPQLKGSSADIIVTVGMPPEEPTETHFTTDARIPSTSSRSIRRLSFHSAISIIDADPDDFSDRESEYRASRSYRKFETRVSKSNGLAFSIGNESDRGSPFSGAVDGKWDGLSVISRETFETAQEPPPELLLALGLHLDPGQTLLPTIDELSLAESPPGLTGMSSNEGRNHNEECMDPGNPLTGSTPLYNISFIRDVSNVCIIGSRINFTTNIMHPNDDLRVGLHTLYLRSDPTALHNSYERQKKINKQLKAIRAWGSQLLLTSSSTLGEYPLSVPSIKTRDLEDVVKDVFTWLYSVSSPHSIMWLCDEYEGESRTSLIGQCLANFFAERRDLTASYFYTKRKTFSQAGTAHPVADRKDDPSSIIPTIAYELTRRIPEIELPIALTAANDLWIFDLSLDEQMKKLIVDPLQAAASNIAKGDSHKFPQLFLIHGLEDCDDHDFQDLFLRALGKSLLSLQQSIPQKLMLLGRHTAHLQECLLKPEMQGVVQKRLLPVSQDMA